MMIRHSGLLFGHPVRARERTVLCHAQSVFFKNFISVLSTFLLNHKLLGMVWQDCDESREHAQTALGAKWHKSKASKRVYLTERKNLRAFHIILAVEISQLRGIIIGTIWAYTSSITDRLYFCMSRYRKFWAVCVFYT